MAFLFLIYVMAFHLKVKLWNFNTHEVEKFSFNLITMCDMSDNHELEGKAL